MSSGLEKFTGEKKESEQKPEESTAFTTYQAPVEEEEQGAIVEADRVDEQQIVEMLRGRAIDKLFHEIPVKDRQGVIVGTTPVLSWAGVKYLTLQLGHITIDEVKLKEKEDKYVAIAWARDKSRDVRVMGAAEQSKTMRLKDQSRVPDEFALAKAVSKAQRNALRNLLPETLISEAYLQWKNRKPQG